MINKTLIAILVVCFGIAGCTRESNMYTPTTDTMDQTQTDMTATRGEIPENCTVYFDGCNTCHKNEDGTSACTRKYCEQYEKSYCMDDEITDDGEDTDHDTNNDLITSDLDDEYIGLTREEAQKLAQSHNTTIRAISIDGEPQILTADYRKGRINATVKNEVVTDISIE